ncbi:MAG: translesion error-prone DNA polymerase V autoproteolytic subunit [Bacteroidota bacterium]
MSKVEILNIDLTTKLELPFINSGLVAGFPSPAQDYIEQSIDLNKELIKNPTTTFFGRVTGESMKDAGINQGDVIIIDKSLEISNNKIAVCYIDGEFTIKKVKLDKKKNEIWLMPANKDFQPIKITAQNDFLVWGIVTYIIKKM